ncbi:MAG: molecular chaperone TorD family protein [Bacteroidota bacterium]
MMNQTLEMLALLLEYPGPEYDVLVQKCCSGIAADCQGSGEDSVPTFLGEFRTRVAGRERGDLEDLYTRTFDLNPVCSLDVGWHLYAENYDRGAFLVTMRGELRRHGIAEMTELPDHLPLVLKLLSRMPMEERTALIGESILPAMKKMIDGFRESDNPFLLLVKAVEAILLEAFHQQSGVSNHG